MGALSNKDIQTLDEHRRQNAVPRMDESTRWDKISQALRSPQANNSPQGQVKSTTDANAQIALPPVPDREAEFTGAANQCYASVAARRGGGPLDLVAASLANRDGGAHLSKGRLAAALWQAARETENHASTPFCSEMDISMRSYQFADVVELRKYILEVARKFNRESPSLINADEEWRFWNMMRSADISGATLLSQEAFLEL